MKKTIRQKLAAVLLLVMMMTVLCSCVAANSEIQVKQSGKAVISASILMDEQSLRDIYGMPTNFYDAVEKDERFVNVLDWKKEYTDVQIDGVNYTGVKISGEFSKKNIQNALNQLYGRYASVSYNDKNFFGSRTVSLYLNSNGNRLMAEELQSALDGQLLSTLTITLPGSVKSVTGGTKNGDKTIVLDTHGLLTGETPNVSMEAKFSDFTFFIPVAIVVAVVVAGLVFLISRVKHETALKRDSKSIKLEKKPQRSSLSDDLDKPYKPKSKMTFAKSAPKYTSETTTAAAAPSVPKPSFAPKAQSTAPAAQSVSEPESVETPVAVSAPPKPAYQPTQFRRRMPSASTFTAAPAPAPQPVAEPVYEEPAAPAYEEPVYEQPAYEEPVYEEPAYEETAYAEPAYEEHVYEEAAYEEAAYEEPAYEEPAYQEPAYEEPVYEQTASAKFGRTSGALMHQQTQMEAYRETAGSAKFSKENRNSAPAATTSGPTIFTPRSTAPNYSYGMEGYHENHEVKDGFEKTESSTLFTPRSTAANLNYGHEPEEHRAAETLHTGSTLFTPRSTAPNMNYGVKDPIEGERSIYDEPERNKDFFYGKDFTKAQKSTTYEPDEGGATGTPVYGHVEFEEMTPDEAAEYESTHEDYSSPVVPVDTPTIQPIEDTGSVGSIYDTNGYESSAYESASSGYSEKPTAIKEAYGGSKLGSGAYVGGATTGTRVGRSVGNIGGYVDETMVNTSSYGSDPFGGTPLPKLGEMGAGGAGMFAIGSTGGFGASSYEGNSIGEGTFGSSKYQAPAQESRTTDLSSVKPHVEASSSFGKHFNTGGSGKFDFGMASGDSGRKCPFCKEPIRDDDIMCVACGATLSRPYGSF